MTSGHQVAVAERRTEAFAGLILMAGVLRLGHPVSADPWRLTAGVRSTLMARNLGYASVREIHLSDVDFRAFKVDGTPSLKAVVSGGRVVALSELMSEAQFWRFVEETHRDDPRDPWPARYPRGTARGASALPRRSPHGRRSSVQPLGEGGGPARAGRGSARSRPERDGRRVPRIRTFILRAQGQSRRGRSGRARVCGSSRSRLAALFDRVALLFVVLLVVEAVWPRRVDGGRAGPEHSVERGAQIR
jgi:hypothetical protein